MLVRRNPAKIVKGRKEYDCEATRCVVGREIGKGEVHVAVHDSSPAGPSAHHQRQNHFSVRYHVRCYGAGNNVDRQTTLLTFPLEDMEGYDHYQDEVARLLKSGEEPDA